VPLTGVTDGGDTVPDLPAMTAAAPRLNAWRRPFSLVLTCLPFGIATWLIQTTPALPPGSLQPLLPSVVLLQTFPPPGGVGKVPPIWQERLPPALAQRLQRQSSAPWSQAWSSHSGTPPFLILRDLPVRFPVRHSFRWGTYTIVAADPLSLQTLQADLKRPLAAGHRSRCPQVDGPPPALFWSGDAFASLSGPLAPLLQPWQEGCLTLGSAGGSTRRLRWSGRVTSQPPLRRAQNSHSAPGPSIQTIDSPIAPLLALEGSSLEPLIGSLLRPGPLLSELRQRHGLSAPLERQLLASPFRLILKPNGADAPYRVTLLLALPKAPGSPSPTRTLAPLLAALGRDLPEDLRLKRDADVSRVVDASDQVRGGWLQNDGGVVFSLGGPPDPAPLAAGPVGLARGLRLDAAPVTLNSLQLLPQALPEPVRRSPRLQALWTPEEGSSAAAQFSGWLTPAVGSP
jgi:hypothetical protein